MSRPEQADRQTDLREAMRCLEDLTPGGSEFCGDPKFCFDYVKDQLNKKHEAMLANARLKKEQQAMQLSLDGLAEALWSFISDADAQELHVGSLTSHQRDARAQARAALKAAKQFLKKETP